MALETWGITCPPGEWTLIIDGDETAVFKMRDTGSVYVYAGQDEPEDVPPTWQHYYTLVASRPFPGLKELSASDRVWVCPKGEAAKVIEVIRA